MKLDDLIFGDHSSEEIALVHEHENRRFGVLQELHHGFSCSSFERGSTMYQTHDGSSSACAGLVHHVLVDPACSGLMNAGRIDEDDLAFLFRQNPEHALARGLRLGRDDRKRRTQDLVQKRGFPEFGRPTMATKPGFRSLGPVTIWIAAGGVLLGFFFGDARGRRHRFAVHPHFDFESFRVIRARGLEQMISRRHLVASLNDFLKLRLVIAERKRSHFGLKHRREQDVSRPDKRH